MVSFVTLRTFEMVLAVSLICLDSKRMSKETLVENLTIDRDLELNNRIHWIGMEPDAPGVRIR